MSEEINEETQELEETRLKTSITSALLVPADIVQGTIDYENRKRRPLFTDDSKEHYKEIDMHRDTYLKFQLGFMSLF